MSRVNCAACRTANQEGAKFCLECGKPFAASCPKCGDSAPPRAKFCMACGQALGAPTAPGAPPAPVDPVRRYIPPELLAKLEAVQHGGGMQGERRIVTMLFCDVKGSTAAAGRLDPEEWAEIMNGAFARLIAPVYRYEGTLARLMGDAILAFFGAPIAHEDDPQRAVLAALAILREIDPYREDIRQRFGIEFDVRVGINTGLVVVGEVGSDLRLEYTAMGDAVNLAARMEQTAEPGTVRVTEATYRQVAPLFEAEEIGPVEVKGKSEAVRVYRIVGAKPKPGRLRGVEGLDSPMVGRDRELAVLRGAAAAVLEGSGRVVSVMAEAGLGKSRLVAELHRMLKADGLLARIGFHEGRTLSYQTAVPYAPVADLLRSLLGLDADSPNFAALVAAVTATTGDTDLADAVAPFLASPLGVPVPPDGPAAHRVRYLEPPALQAGISGAVGDVLAALAAKRPLLLVLEDLHWADSSSLALLERLLPLADQGAVLLVLVLRPRPDEPSWRLHEVAGREHAHRYTSLTLDPLAEEDTRALVAHLLHVEGLTASVRDIILEKSEGNPYFVEEVIRSLIDQGVIVRDSYDWRATREIDGITIPGSLAAVLGARLDRLSEATRRVAQIAAVVGREVDFDVLAAVIGAAPEEAVTELQRRGLLRERSRIPRRVYWFKHVLVQEAAYASLLLKARREAHGKVADVLARLDAHRPADIARHYLEAKEERLALPFLVVAAERAARAYSTPEALRLFDRAVAIVGAGTGSDDTSATSDAALATRAFEGRGTALMLSMNLPGALENWQAMRAWATAQGQEPMRVSALNKLAMIHGLMLGDEAQSRRLLDESEAAAQVVGCQPGLAEGCMVRCAIHLGRAEFDTAYQYLDRASELGRAMQAEEPLLFGMAHVTNTLLYMTEYDRVWPQAEATLAKARELGNKKYECEIKAYAIPLYLLREGDVAGAIAAAREGAEIAERIGDGPYLAAGLTVLARLACLEGRYEDAIAFGERGLAIARSTGLPYIGSLALACFGATLIEADEQLRERAQALHTEALAVMQQPSGDFFGSECRVEMGFAALGAGDLARARTLFDEGLTTPSATMRLSRPRLLVGAAEVALAEGRLADAAARVAEARAFVDARKMRHEDPLVRLTEGRLAATGGDNARASALYAEAEAAASRLGFKPLVARARAEAAACLESGGSTHEPGGSHTSGAALLEEMAAAILGAELRKGFLATARERLSRVALRAGDHRRPLPPHRVRGGARGGDGRT